MATTSQPVMLEEMQDYYWNMAARQRLISVDEGRTALCTFFILDSELEVHDFYDRPCWTTPRDHKEGLIIYIDKLLTQGFTRALWRVLEQAVTEYCPSWEKAVWYRPTHGDDRRYIYRRRR